jgi:hypothetical protein
MIFIDSDTLVNEKKILMVHNRTPKGVSVYGEDQEPLLKTEFGNCKMFYEFLAFAGKYDNYDTFQDYVMRQLTSSSSSDTLRKPTRP